MSDKIRVHNRGKREYTIPPVKKGGKTRMIQPGRAIEIEKGLALKMIEAYPNDLVEFDSLVSGGKKDINKENARLESSNKTLLGEKKELTDLNQALKNKIAALEDEVKDFKDKIDNPKVDTSNGNKKATPKQA